MIQEFKTQRGLLEAGTTLLVELLKEQSHRLGLTPQFKQTETDPLGSIIFSGKISPLHRAFQMARQTLTSLAPNLPAIDKNFDRLAKLAELEASRRLGLNNHGPYY